MAHTTAQAHEIAVKTGKSTKILHGKVHVHMGAGVWEEYKHPRGHGGKFATKPGGGPSISAPVGTSPTPVSKGKQPPANWKFYKPGYKPKGWDQIKGRNAKSSGNTLYSMKKSGAFQNDYEFWLAAQKLAAAHKKKHPTGAATPNQIVNAAFRHELEDTGDVKLGVAHAEQGKATLHEHGATAGGVQVVSKYLAPGQLKPTGKKMPGVNGALVYEDSKGAQWLVKFPGGSKGTSKAYSNSLFLVDLDVATSRIQSKGGLPVPAIHQKVVDGKIASVHKMYSRVADAFPNNKVDLHALSDKEVTEVQQNMVLDWLLSNHDPHSGNFLKTDKGIIGIDKGQSFKYFGKDHLTPNFGSDINPPLSPNVPVYSALMQQHMKDNGGLLPFNEGEIGATINRLMAIPDAEYMDMLRPYAEKAAKVGLLNYPGKKPGEPPKVYEFLVHAVERKNNLAKDFQKLWDQLNAKEMGSPKKVDAFGGPPASKANKDKPIPDVAGKLAVGYQILPTSSGTFSIKKPSGELSKSKDGTIKEWPTAEDALNSSTMVKYKAQGDQQAKAGMAGAQAFAANAPVNDIDAVGNLKGPDAFEYAQLKNKIAAGEGHTPDEYLKLKSWVSQIQNSAKAAGAAQIEHGFDTNLGGFEPPTPLQTAVKKGKLPTPKWKKKGGAPAPLSAAKGPNALMDGGKLYEMKKAGKFDSDEDLWKAASKLSNLYKKKAQANAPGQKLVSGEDYASPNQIRNVSQRLEFDDVGDVIWETKVEKTAHVESQTAKQVKSTNVLHAHVPVVKASASHHVSKHTVGSQYAGEIQSGFSNGAFDASAPVGSYTNPHAFKIGDTNALQAYGYKYTDHSGNWPADQKSAWYNFSGGGSGSVNTYFRVGAAGFSFGNIEETKKRCQALVAAFKSDKVKPLEDWTQVVRGTAGGWEFGIGSDTVSFDQIKAQEGKVVRNKEPKSSSLRDQPPWGSIRITYKLPPGFRGLGIYGKSSHSSENEMILPPGMAYRILEVKESSNSTFGTEVLVEVVDVKLPEIT